MTARPSRTQGKTQRYFSTVVADRRTVAKVFKHHYRGHSRRKIAAALGVSAGSVANWTAYPNTYYPWVDEVALWRVERGDAATANVLTVFERDELRKRWTARLKREPYVQTIHHPTSGDGIPHWTDILAPTIGTDGNTLRTTLSRT